MPGTVGICVFARGAGEGNTYLPGSALNFAGEATGADPLALSEDERAVIDAAKETCDKVVLINSGNNMVLKEIATGALPDTYVADNASLPAMMNFGG